MKKILLATLALASVATSANALTLVNATVSGPSGTVWNTTQDGFYTLFLSSPNPGDYLNPNDEAISFGIANSGFTRALLTGEGFTPGTTVNSDPTYNLTLSFDTGQMLTGTYTVATNSFSAGSSIVSAGKSYTLTEFSFTRTLADVVQPYTAVPGGDSSDYNGNFRISAGAVPEPASWALMIIGFGMVGVTARRRSRTTAIAA